MKPNLLILTGACCIAAFLFSCGKNEQPPAEKKLEKKSSTTQLMACMPMRQWKGYYLTGDVYDSVSSDDFISNGVARVTGTPEFPGAEFWTSIRGYSSQMSYCGFHIASNGDSLSLTVRVKNPRTRPQPKYWDVTVALMGEQNSASAVFIGGTQQQVFAGVGVGDTSALNLPEMIDVFDNWREIKLTTSNNVLSVYLDGVLQKSFTYTGRRIGKLMNIDIGFKGSGYVDWVELVEQAEWGAEIKMRDDFNDDVGMHWYIDGVEVFI